MGNRAFNWEIAAGIQHELLNGLSVETSHHRRWFGNLRVLDNLDVTPADYDPYCVRTPVNSRLPGGGGQTLCGFADIKPAKLGVNTNEWIRADDLGARRVYDDVDFNVNARLRQDVILQGGVSIGRLSASVVPNAAAGVASGTQPLTPTCFVVDSPQVTELCNDAPPFQAQIKGSAVVPLPWWNIETAVTYQSIPGIDVRAQWAAPNAAIAPSLVRDLAGGARTANVQLIKPFAMVEDRLHQIDLRVGRSFRISRTTIRPQLSIFNLFNSATVLAINTAYGPNWLRPTNILAPRIATVGAQINF